MATLPRLAILLLVVSACGGDPGEADPATDGEAAAESVPYLSRTASLAGITEMAVEVDIAGIRDISESRMRDRLESALEARGIRVVPLDADGSRPDPTLPRLVFELDAALGYQCNTSISTIDMQVRVDQPAFVRRPDGTTHMVMMSGYREGTYGMLPSIQVRSLYGDADDLIDAVLDAWSEANPQGVPTGA